MPENHVFRPGGISYLRIPSEDVPRSATFYAAAFGWQVDGDRASFEDGSGHVIGHWVDELDVVGEAGIVPYVYVDSVDATLAKIREHGGEVVRDPYPEGDLRLATFRDPSGKVLGVWQSGYSST